MTPPQHLGPNFWEFYYVKRLFLAIFKIQSNIERRDLWHGFNIFLVRFIVDFNDPGLVWAISLLDLWRTLMFLTYSLTLKNTSKELTIFKNCD